MSDQFARGQKAVWKNKFVWDKGNYFRGKY